MVINDPRKYVTWWLTTRKISVDERGGLTSPDKRDYFELFDTLVLDYCQQIADFNRNADRAIKAAPETNLKKALDEIISVKMVERREEVFAALKFNGKENLSNLETFVKAVTGKAENKVVGVLAHFLWQVKRRMADKEVVFHIMPIMVGAQGGGKSLSLQRLFKPLIHLTLELSLTEVTDARFYFALNKNYIAVLDEMAGAKRADVEVLKKQISASYNDVRKLNTNTVTKIKQNASFIGTSNRNVNELIFDSTGARRFYEIKALDRLDWNAINSINYNELYQGINENRERGYLEDVLSEVVEDQKDLIGIDELTEFIDANQIKPGTKEITAHTLYGMYKEWNETNGVKHSPSASWFGRKLKNRSIDSIEKRVRGKLVKFYLIDEKSMVHNKTFDPLAVTVSAGDFN